MTHDLIDFTSTTDVVIGQVLDVNAFRLFLVNLQVIILCCYAMSSELLMHRHTHGPISHVYVPSKFPSKRLSLNTLYEDPTPEWTRRSAP